MKAWACCPTSLLVSQEAWIAACSIRRDCRVEFFRGRGADGDEAGVAEDAVPGGEVGFLLEHVAVFGGLGGVFDLPHLLPLRRVRDQLGLLLSDVPRRLIRTNLRTHQRERVLNPGGQQYRGEEPRIHSRPRPLRYPQHRVIRGVRSQPIPRLGDRDRARQGKRPADAGAAFEDRGGGGVVGGAEDHRDLRRGQPPGDRELRRPERRHQGGHLLPHRRRRL